MCTESRLRDPSRYAVSLAGNRTEVREAQRLRFAVFAEELGARLPGSASRIDEDAFDAHCEHLLVREAASGEVVGTYRILPPEGARRAGALYSEGEFDFSRLAPIRDRMVEVGRACVHPRHRSAVVMLLLWSALARYVAEGGYDYFVGAASVGLDDGGGLAAAVQRGVREGHQGPEALRVFPRVPFVAGEREPPGEAAMPPLLKGYLGMGAWVCGEPAFDPDFNCADFPVLLDLERLDARFARHFLKRAA